MSETVKDFAPSGVFVRKSSGLVRTVSTLDTFFYCLLQIAITYVIFIFKTLLIDQRIS
jgi:hypothetical protein